MNQLISKKQFYLVNAALLLLIGSILFLKAAPTASFVEQLGPLLAVYLISSFAYYLLQYIHNSLHLILLILGVIMSYWILGTFFIIILERFFRVEEHYTLHEFAVFLSINWVFTLDAMLWSIGYSTVFYLLKVNNKLNATEMKTASLEKALYQSDLNTLRKEINPHFLFNAMNSIAMKVRLKENKTAVAMIAALNDLLRLSLKKGDEKLITVSYELELLQKYLLIEQQRFGDTTKIDIAVDQKILDRKIPELILQPLVENAFKHNNAQNSAFRTVRISGEKTAKGLAFYVYNSTSGSSRVNFTSQGVGLPNVVHRLRRIYGTDFRFQSYNEENGIVFKISIPEIP